MKPFKLTMFLITLAVTWGTTLGLVISSCTPKNTVGAVCPTNAICDKIDFGVGAITVCLSPEDLIKLQLIAAQQRQLNGESRRQDAGN